MIIHGGGVYGNKQETLARFGRNLAAIDARVRKYIVLENDDYQYTVLDLLPLCEEYSVPLVIDFFHHECNGAGEFQLNNEVLQRVMTIWRRRNIQPKFHWSNQRPDARKGNHHDTISDIPQNILRFMIQYDADLMLECKFKERCLQPLLEQYYTKIKSGQRIDWIIKRD